MTDQAQELCLLYDMRRREVVEVAQRFDEALEEDRRVNADMFDITRTTFSQNQHPNATMRALEADLEKADLPFLHLLIALCEIGMEVSQRLCSPSDKAEFADMAGERFDQLSQSDLPAVVLAHTLTEIKAEHALTRLVTAIRMMELPC